VAADVLAVLEAQASPYAAGQLGSAFDGTLTRPASGRARGERPRPEPAASDITAGIVQELLDALPDAHAWLIPVRDAAGEVVDFRVDAASPEAVDSRGRQGTQMVGARIRETLPGIV